MTHDPGTIGHEPAAPAREPTDWRATIAKLLVASLIVGVVLDWLDFTPAGLLRFVGESLRNLFEDFGAFLSSMAEWLLLGAIVVIPIWLLARVMSNRRNR